MAELHHILGSILRDVSQSRVTSDLYSRNISKYYEQDPLLRRFPIPRTDIEEVEIDLKFAISGIETNASQNENREAITADLLVRFSEAIAQYFFDALIGGIDKLVAEESIPHPDEETVKRIRFFEHRIYLKQDILVYFQRHRERLVKLLDSDKVLSDLIEDIMERRFYTLETDPQETKGIDVNQLLFQQSPPEIKQVLGDIKAAVLDKAFKEGLSVMLKELEEPLSAIWHQGGDKKANVEVTVAGLSELSEQAVSTIKVKARVKNYRWSKVEHEGKRWRALDPD
jgi:plasmid stabilization system protein ParE